MASQSQQDRFQGRTKAASSTCRALSFAHLSPHARFALVNGAFGAVVAPDGHPFAVLGFTITNGKVAEIDVLSDPVRLAELDLSALG